MLKKGIHGVKEQIREQMASVTDEEKKIYYTAMNTALDAALVLAGRYADLAHKKWESAGEEDKPRFAMMEAALPGADTEPLCIFRGKCGSDFRTLPGNGRD